MLLTVSSAWILTFLFYSYLISMDLAASGAPAWEARVGDLIPAYDAAILEVIKLLCRS